MDTEWGIRNTILDTFLTDFGEILEPAQRTLLKDRLRIEIDKDLQYKAPEVYDHSAWALVHRCISRVRTGGRGPELQKLWESALEKAETLRHQD